MYLNDLDILSLTLLLYMCVFVQNPAGQECGEKSPINFNLNHFNVRLNGYTIQNMTVPAAADCARECFRLTPCLSFNMATSIGLCELNSLSSTNLIPNLVADNRFNYLDLSIFPDVHIIAGTCGKKPCLKHQRCIPTKDKHTCATIEKQLGCPPYIAPTNGKVTPTTAVIADGNVTVSCLAGYSLVGDSLLTCQLDGHWRGVPPTCNRAPTNGKVTPATAVIADGNVTVSCLAEFSLVGDSLLTCQLDGQWKGVAPTCKRVYDCYDVLHFGIGNNSGIYTVNLQRNVSLDVYCDMTTVGGGWTVFQYRYDGSVDFFATFDQYENGFGDVHGEFWMGLRYIHEMTDQKSSEIYLNFVDSKGNIAMELFGEFYISAGANYTLHVGALLQQNDSTDACKLCIGNYDGKRFSAKDVDQDIWDNKNCAQDRRGGWWYKKCGNLNPNGEYVTPGQTSSYANGRGGMINEGWRGFESLKSTKLMFRRI